MIFLIQQVVSRTYAGNFVVNLSFLFCKMEKNGNMEASHIKARLCHCHPIETQVVGKSQQHVEVPQGKPK